MKLKEIAITFIFTLYIFSCNKTEMYSSNSTSNELKLWSEYVIKNSGVYEKKYVDSVLNIVDTKNTFSLQLPKNRNLVLIKLKTTEISYLALLIYDNKHETYGILRTNLKTSDSDFKSQIYNYVINSKLLKDYYFERFDLHNKLISKQIGVNGNKIKETSIQKGLSLSSQSNHNIKTNSCDNYYFIIKIDGVVVDIEYAYSVCNNAALDMPGFIYSGDNNVYLEDKIITDTSIMNNINIKCVYENLTATVLKDILVGFSNSDVYNLRFTLDPNMPMNKEGMTTKIAANDFLISINPNLIDNSYSKIWTASLFIHEAFHAQLFLKSQQMFGNQDLAKWPTPINEMDLNELMNYFEQNSKSNNIWESVNHDWMVNNLDIMSQKLQNYVSIYFPAISSEINSMNLGLVPYQSLMYKGLEKSILFKEKFPDNFSYPGINYLVTTLCSQ